jgi:hypothetical protein
MRALVTGALVLVVVGGCSRGREPSHDAQCARVPERPYAYGYSGCSRPTQTIGTEARCFGPLGDSMTTFLDDETYCCRDP